MRSSTRWSTGFLALTVLAILGIGAPASAQQADQRFALGPDEEAPTFYGDVLPVLQQNCVECHQERGLNAGGMVAPMALTSYETAREFAPMIAFQVSEGNMPPWDVHPQHQGDFRGERYLTPEEKETLVTWARNGTPEGNSADAPPPVEFPKAGGDDWWIGEPDFTLFFDEPYFVEDSVSDQYVDIPVEVTEEMLPEHRWVKAREARPGGPHVHHIVGGVQGMAPGSMPTVYEDGYSTLFCKGPRTITFNMHYNKEAGPGTGVEDVSGGGVVFYEEGDVIRHVVSVDWLGIMDFVIPPGESNYSDTAEKVFEEDMLILGFNPHMHLRGKAAKYELTYPDGESEVLLYIPEYDFSWQQGYDLKEPVLAPEGSKLEMTLWWDNSADNPDNPDPTKTVTWGEPTTAEMGFGFVSLTPAEPRDIVVGEPIPEDVAQMCNQGVGPGGRVTG